MLDLPGVKKDFAAGALYFDQELILPSPGTTIRQLWLILQSEAFWPAVGATVARGLAGFLISCLLGIVIGLGAGLNSVVCRLMHPWVTVIKATSVMPVIISVY